MKKLGGTEALTAFARSIGDDTFTLENQEPDLNSNPAHLSDTSTPKAMATSLQKLALGNVLALRQRELFGDDAGIVLLTVYDTDSRQFQYLVVAPDLKSAYALEKKLKKFFLLY